MPEMLQYCGRRFRVYKTAHKTCDTVRDYNIRRMTTTVHLEGLRCDGAAHGGCQAGCLLYFKEAWLKRVPVPGGRVEALAPVPVEARHVLQCGTRVPARGGETEDRYRCQATDLLAFTTPVRRRERWDPRFYVQDVTSGNVSLRDFIWYGAIAAVNAFAARWFGRRYPHLCGAAVKQPPSTTRTIETGDVVRVRSKAEVEGTLGPNMRNRGLHFDVEMVPFCDNASHEVLRRVEKIVDEKTGRLITLPNPCLILDGVTCSGRLSSSRMFCPRNIYPFWREVWLSKTNRDGENDGDGAVPTPCPDQGT